jgi:nucleotide-binding universal stress UspA family protein
MALKDLLVHVDRDPAWASRVAVAVGLAASHDAHLTGLHVMAWPTLPGALEAGLPPSFYDNQRAALAEGAREAEAGFLAQVRGAGVRAEWRAVEGPLIPTAQLHARYADLTVVGQGIDLDLAPGELAFLPEELALGTGRPVLVVPRYGTFEAVGSRVLVAWNGSREATRAVHDALPLLERAVKVTVLSIDPEGPERARDPGADLALHLARHGITAEAASTRTQDVPAGDVLLSRAFDLGADLIVMGAYGHSRMREMVLGGVTRHLLQHMTVPVLLSH